MEIVKYTFSVGITIQVGSSRTLIEVDKPEYCGRVFSAPGSHLGVLLRNATKLLVVRHVNDTTKKYWTLYHTAVSRVYVVVQNHTNFLEDGSKITSAQCNNNWNL